MSKTDFYICVCIFSFEAVGATDIVDKNCILVGQKQICWDKSVNKTTNFVEQICSPEYLFEQIPFVLKFVQDFVQQIIRSVTIGKPIKNWSKKSDV